MDALALLCTLHADGPATLKRFRRAGCTTLDHLHGIDVERVASLLQSSPAAARRFLREAQSLAERVGRGVLDREDHAIAARATHTGRESASVDGDDGARSSDAPAPHLAAREQEIVEKVLETWRERDREETAWSREEDADETASDAMPEPSIAASLKPGTIDGLDEQASALLGALGIGDLESLARIDPLDIARRTGIAYTKLARLRFLASRDVRATTRSRVAQSPSRDGRHDREQHAPTPYVPRDRATPHEKFSKSEMPIEALAPALDLERDLLTSPRAPLPAAGSWAQSHARETHADRHAHGDRSGGPFA